MVGPARRPSRTPATASPQAGIVGRSHELAALQAAWRRALTGRRQVCFVSGEAGIGKTVLLEAFLAAQERSRKKPKVARGQCVEHYGTGEPFLPILEGIGRLCTAAGGSRTVSVLRREAPSWLLQLPRLAGAAERASLERRYAGSGRERIVGEMVAGLEALAAHAPLMLVLEDLHWSDRSTLTLLAALAGRSEPARLLVLGTYRPAQAATIDPAVPTTVQELLARGAAHELALAPLDEASVGAYLTQRFAGSGLADGPLTSILRRQTGGNPLFLISAVDHLVGCGLIDAADGQWSLRASAAEIERAVPESLRRTIERQMERLQSATWPLLEAASVVGADFTTRAVAAALGVPVPSIENDLAALARSSSVVQALGPVHWPDGSETAGFRFVHTLYRDVIYDGLMSARRRDLHRRIAQVIATGWAAQPAEVAAVLAMHFERAADHTQATKYRRLAGDAAARRYAYEESIDHYRAALALLDAQPPGRARRRGAGAAGRARAVVDHHAGVRRPRRRSHLHAGARSLPQPGRATATLPGDRGIAHVLHHARRVARGVLPGAADAQHRRAGRRPRPALRGGSHPGLRGVPHGKAALVAQPPGARHRAVGRGVADHRVHVQRPRPDGVLSRLSRRQSLGQRLSGPGPATSERGARVGGGG